MNHDPNQGRDVHLLIGTGGSRSILFGTGVLLALSQTRFRHFRSIGGVSGGSIPTSLISANPNVAALLERVLATDFHKLVKRRVSLINFLTQVVRDPKPIDPPPLVGALDAEAMGAFFDEHIQDWPRLFWTVALTHQRKVIMTAEGIYVEQEGGGIIKDADRPPPIGTAIRATCAVPILLDPVPWVSADGVEHLLIDGGLGPEGRCPTSIPKFLHAMHDSYLIVVNLGEDKSHLHKLLDSAFGTDNLKEPSLEDDEPGPLPENYTRIVISPPYALSGSFKFQMTRREKWQMIMCGYMTAVDMFDKHGMYADCTVHHARERGLRALLLLATRRRPYFTDTLPPELDKVFADLRFSDEQFGV